MNKTIPTRKPIQADDYGRSIPKQSKIIDTAKNANTDGRKVLALWGQS